MRVLFIVLALTLVGAASAMAADSTAVPSVAPAAGPSPCPPPCPEVATCPSVCGSGPASTCGTGPCVACDWSGNVMLTSAQAERLYNDGNDWLDVAIAVNVARETGYPLREVLTQLRSQGTWQQTLLLFGVSAEDAYNVADYPFVRTSIYTVGVDAQHQNAICKYQKPGTWPTCRLGNPPCPGGVGTPVTVVPVPCPDPCGTGPICPSPQPVPVVPVSP